MEVNWLRCFSFSSSFNLHEQTATSPLFPGARHPLFPYRCRSFSFFSPQSVLSIVFQAIPFLYIFWRVIFRR